MLPDPTIQQLDAAMRQIAAGFRVNTSEKITADFKEITVRDLERGLPRGELLKPGDRLSGQVLSARKDDKPLIDFGKFRAKADVNFPVGPRDVLNVKVTEIGSRMIKMVLDSTGQSSMSGRTGPGVVVSENSLKEFIATMGQTLKNNAGFPAGARASDDVARLLATIKGHFEPLSMEDAAARLSRQLQSRIKNAGLFFEKRLESALVKLSETDAKSPLQKLLQQTDIKRVLENDLKPVLCRARARVGNLAGAKAGANAGANAAGRAEGRPWGRIQASLTSLICDIQNRQARVATRGGEASPGQNVAGTRGGEASPGQNVAAARGAGAEAGVEPSKPQTILSRLIQEMTTHLKASGGSNEKSLETALVKLVEAEKTLSTALRLGSARTADTPETRGAPPTGDPTDGKNAAKPQGARLDLQPAMDKDVSKPQGKPMFQATAGTEASRVQGKQSTFQPSEMAPSVPSRGAPASSPTPGGASVFSEAGRTGGNASGSSVFSEAGRTGGNASGASVSSEAGRTGGRAAGTSVSSEAGRTGGSASVTSVFSEAGKTGGRAAGSGVFSEAGRTGGHAAGSGVFSEAGRTGGSASGTGAVVGGSGGSPGGVGGGVGGAGGSVSGMGAGSGGAGGGAGAASGSPGGTGSGVGVTGGGGGGATEWAANILSTGSETRRAGDELLERIVAQQKPGAESGRTPLPLNRPLDESIIGSRSEKEIISGAHRETEAPPTRADKPEAKGQPGNRLPAGVNRLFGRILANLKPELQALERYFERVDEQTDKVAAAGHKQLHKTVGELIRTIEQQQTEPREQAPDAMQMISYDLLLKESDQKARLKIFYRKKKRENREKDHRASLQLKMNKIGDIRTDFILAGKRLDITFHVNGVEIKRKIEDHSHEVRGRLTELVDDLSMEVKVSEKKPQTGTDGGPSDFGENRFVDLKV